MRRFFSIVVFAGVLSSVTGAAGSDLPAPADQSAGQGSPDGYDITQRCAAYGFATCLAMLEIQPPPIAEIDAGLGLKAERTSLADCAGYARLLRLETAAFRWTTVPQGFSLRGAPAMLPIVLKGHRGHFIAAVATRRPDQLLIIDYPLAPTWVSAEQLRKKWGWDGTMLHIARDQRPLQKLSSLAARRRASTWYLVAGLISIVVAAGVWVTRRKQPKMAPILVRTSAARAGFTIIELLITLAIISLLVGLILPAIQSAREASRQLACQNNLHQIGVALEAFHASRNKYPAASVLSVNNQGEHTNNVSPHVELLPFLDQQALYAQFDRSESGTGVEQDPPSSNVNAALLAKSLEIFTCPSDPIDQLRCNYRISCGTSPWMHETLPRSPFGALQGFRSLLGRSDATFTDGKSHTAAFSEKLAGDRDPKRYTPWRDSVSVKAVSPGLLTPDDAVRACERPVGPNPQHFSYGGMTWVLSGYPQTWYNHVLPPNSGTPDCVNGGPMAHGAFTARALHHGGVNVLFADGSVHFKGSSIDLDVWRALGTVDGNEVVPEE